MAAEKPDCLGNFAARIENVECAGVAQKRLSSDEGSVGNG
jgi:hypothetical protein